MGPYCRYCDMRCFLPRVVPGRAGSVLMATCDAGMRHDREQCDGHDHRTTVNPITGEVDLKVQVRTAPDERLCENVACAVAKVPGGSVMIPAGEVFAAVTTRADQHDRVQILHPPCLLHVHKLVLGQVATVVADDPRHPPMAEVTECRMCGSTDLEWAWSPHNRGQAVNGRLTLHEVVSLFHLGCVTCSETLAVIDPDEVAALLNAKSYRPVVSVRPAAAG